MNNYTDIKMCFKCNGRLKENYTEVTVTKQKTLQFIEAKKITDANSSGYKIFFCAAGDCHESAIKLYNKDTVSHMLKSLSQTPPTN